ncbi:MAG: DUF1851 domain-containing protein [Elusimicrobia bacterium]|nr:DUF1851 domain-containing protein [Elusimicrobiota bacterium]
MAQDPDLSKLVAQIADLSAQGALDDWRWLMGRGARPLLVTAMGDAFVVKTEGFFSRAEVVYFLDTFTGTFVRTGLAPGDLPAALRTSPQAAGWLRVDLVRRLLDRGAKLGAGQCLSAKHPIVLGGNLTPDNFEPTDWQVHLSMLGQVHKQVKDLPPGSTIADIQGGDPE